MYDLFQWFANTRTNCTDKTRSGMMTVMLYVDVKMPRLATIDVKKGQWIYSLCLYYMTFNMTLGFIVFYGNIGVLSFN